MDRYDWLNDDETANVRLVSDLSGHGTFAASLILDYAPDAQLFVARIAEKERIDEKETLKASVIAKVSFQWKFATIKSRSKPYLRLLIMQSLLGEWTSSQCHLAFVHVK